ncbi:MAG: ROK family protein [Alphaproteobacteria bacterium]|nr:ROK family protein [Alphaproteobacteria bacterium]
MVRIGVDLGGTKIEAAALDSDGRFLARRRVPTPEAYADKLSAIGALIRVIESEIGADGLPVGVGHPGSISPRTGLMRNANTTQLNGRPFDRDLAEALGRPVACANDANCFALSEALDGAGAGAGSVFGVIIGTGVGGALVIDGRLHAGQDGNAGEWGHAGLPWPEADEVPGPACKCGLSGCIEAWCSGPALAADHMRTTGETLTGEDIAAAAAAGDARAQATLERHAARLARGLALVINIADPEVIVLGGGLSNLPGLAETLQDKISRWAFTDALTTRIVRNVHGDSSGVRGAAWLNPLEAS